MGLPRRGEWLCTGDEGVRNADGTVTFLGLLKPMFTRNGFNVYPREIERVVGTLPGVHARRGDADARAAQGERHPRCACWGTVTEAQVREWCESRISAYKQPTRS